MRSGPKTEPVLAPTSTRTKLLWVLLVTSVVGGLLLLSGRSEGGTAERPRGLSIERGDDGTDALADASDDPSASPEPEPDAAERAAADQRVRERLRAEEHERTAEARHQARQRVPVVLYSTTWCGVCQRAREYLTANNVRYTEHDVEANPTARAEHLRLNPSGSVPTFDVGGEVLVGFSDAAFSQALDAAVDREAL